MAVLVSLTAWAQSPTTSQQRAVDSTYIAALEVLVNRQTQWAKIDSLVCEDQKAGFRKALTDANADRKRLGDKSNQLSADLDFQIQETNRQALRAEGAEKELRQWKPRTKAGVFFRKVRDGLAMVGGTVILGTALFLAVQ